MHFPPVNYLAVLAAGIVIFVLGGLWYSPVLFAKKWIALQGRTEEQMRAQAASYAMALFSGKPKQLWLIDSTYNLVSFVIAGIILAVWR